MAFDIALLDRQRDAEIIRVLWNEIGTLLSLGEATLGAETHGVMACSFVTWPMLDQPRREKLRQKEGLASHSDTQDN